MPHDNKFMAKVGDKGIGDKGEKLLAKRLGMKLTPASGALEGAKGDLFNDDILVESKATEKDSISIKLNWLIKIATEASTVNKLPALAVQFVTGNGRPRPEGSWVMIPERLYTRLKNEGRLSDEVS